MNSDATLESQKSGDASHVHSPNYLMVFFILCGLTAASVVADMLKQEKIALLIGLVAFAIATIKATYVLMYFMHLKFEGNWKYIILAPTVFLAIGVPLAMMPDISIHYYPADKSRTSAHSELKPHQHGPPPEHVKPNAAPQKQPKLKKPQKKPVPSQG